MDLNYVYNLGIAEELKDYKNNKDAYQFKLRSNLALLKSLKVYQKEV